MVATIIHEIRRFDILDSTNEYCFRNTELLKNGTVVMAGYQSAGKGTQGRTWQSQPDKNLLFSLYYKDEPFTGHPLFSLRIALGLALVLQGYGLSPMIKWPNDLIVDNKKIAGILIEVRQSHCVVGIGFNINQQSFPLDLALPATSLISQLDKTFEPVTVLLKVLDALDEVLVWDDAEVLMKYRDMLYQKGSKCIVNINRSKFIANIEDIDVDGALIVTDQTGKTHKIRSKAMIEE